MVNKLLALINQAGYHLQQAEVNPLHEVRQYNLTRYAHYMRKIDQIKEILEG